MNNDPGKDAPGFELFVPLDASAVGGDGQVAEVQVLARTKAGATYAQTVKLSPKQTALAKLQFESKPAAVTLYVGPAGASPEQLQGMQTITRTLSLAQVAKPQLKLPAISIGTYYWRWWLYRCRRFTIRGRVVCPDGSPVPGAKVCASDVDWWWWWSSQQELACTTTNENGEFQMSFFWCCGYLPLWWWRHRQWQLNTSLAAHVVESLRQHPQLAELPEPTPKPDLEVFARLLDQRAQAPQSSQLLAALGNSAALARAPRAANANLPTTIDPSVLDMLRPALLPNLKATPALERLRVWPWFPWHPWWDCSPDIVFKVTQECDGETRVIVDEQLADVRPNIPQDLDVTLVAKDACCIEPVCDPEGECVVISSVCHALLSRVAGNPGALAATPPGYLDSSSLATGPARDRPFGGNIRIDGVFGLGANTDYYAFEWSDDDGVSFSPMPAAAAGGFTRAYWGPKLGTSDPPAFHSVAFNFTNIDGHLVVESRAHFEAQNEPTSWGLTRFWVSNRDLLMYWKTLNNHADGRYHLRIQRYAEDEGSLDLLPILPLCGTEDDNQLVLVVDNRVEGAASGHPATHPCGPGTVHLCTREPDTDILRVLIDGVPVSPCDVIHGQAGKELRIEFYAHDPDGHLADIALTAHWGDSAVKNLLPLGTLIPGSGSPAPVPDALQVGPHYGAAITQGASAPTWHGGVMTLIVPDMSLALPATCAYQLDLRARKRTVVNCGHSLWNHHNRSEYSFTVQY